MPSITINEKDNTLYNVSDNSSDNIVYVIGASIKGTTEPTLCRNFNEFVAEFGTEPPQVNVGTYGCAWDYATNLLLAGFPVLFQRVISYTNSSGDEVSISKTATVALDDGEDTPTKQMDIYASEAGSYGNDTKVKFESPTIDDTSTPSTMSAGNITAVITKGTKTENIVICTIPENGTPMTGSADVTVSKLFFTGINKITSSLVKFAPVSTLTINTFVVTDGWFTQGTTEVVFTLGATDLTKGTDPLETDVYTNTETVAYALEQDQSFFDVLKDQDLVDVKFLTLGGKTNLLDESLTTPAYTQKAIKALVNIAEDRKDCLAVLDIPASIEPEDGDVSDITNHYSFVASSYATCFESWIYFQLPRTAETKIMPPSFVFLYELAKSIKNGNPIWLSPAGVRRGLVPEASKAVFEIGSVIAEKLQSNLPFINPIRRIRNYGYAIFGQKTLYVVNNDFTGSVRSAFQDLNVRITANEIKRKIRDISISLTFEGNNLKTWNEFRGQLDPYLSQISADGALDNYKIIMDETTTTEDDINNNTVRGKVIVRIARTAEDFNIDFIVTNDTAVFGES